MNLTAFQEQLEAFLSYAEGNVLLWHDPSGRFANALDRLALPDDVVLLHEDTERRFALAQRLNDIAPDERILFYRTRRHRVEANDWFAGLEACAECFDVDASGLELDEPAEATTGTVTDAAEPKQVEAEEATPKPVTDAVAAPIRAADADAAQTSAPSALIESAFDHLQADLDQDWYSLKAFRHAARTALGRQDDLPDDVLGRMLGFTVYADCALRSTWRSLEAFYSSLFQAPLVTHGSIPNAIHAAQSFKQYLFRRTDQMLLFDYDDETWITPDGLRELDIDRNAILAFARDAASACPSALPYLTIPWLRSAGTRIPLLEYELSDAFYESALMPRCTTLGRFTLCGRLVFAASNAIPRGRDFLTALVRRERSIQVDDLLDIFQADYAIPLTRSQLISLVRAAGLQYAPELDRVYIDHNQFIKEME